MSLPAVYARVAQLEAMVQQTVAPQQTPPVYLERQVASTTTPTTPYLGTSSALGTSPTLGTSSASPSFVGALQSALAPTTAGGDTPGARALAVAEREIGVQEEPPGSNDSARIAEYR